MPSNLSQQPHLYAATHPIVRFVAGFSRVLLHQWCASVQVRGLDGFLSLLRDAQRQRRGQGIITYANHISVWVEKRVCLGSSDVHCYSLSVWMTRPFSARFQKIQQNTNQLQGGRLVPAISYLQIRASVL